MSKKEEATFAAGCFWGVQRAFDALPGVLSTSVGYTGGEVKNPTYEEVCTGTTGHVEAIHIEFDADHLSFQDLLDLYWKTIDKSRNDGQFCDIGSQYRPVIFYHNEGQRVAAEEGKKKNKSIVFIRPAVSFYPAEAYHQHYYSKKKG